MGDIAAQAGMSRLALYLLFPNKDANSTLVVRHLSAQQLADIHAALPSLSRLEEKLLFACRTGGADGVELTGRCPDARDLSTSLVRW